MENLKNYTAIINKCKRLRKYKIAVAVAQDMDVLQAVKMAEDIGLADAVLVGDALKIAPMVKKLNIKNAQIIDEVDDSVSAGTAVKLIHENKADILMKGLLNSSDFLRAVLESAEKQSDAFLSHLGVFEIPNSKKN